MAPFSLSNVKKFIFIGGVKGGDTYLDPLPPLQGTVKKYDPFRRGLGRTRHPDGRHLNSPPIGLKDCWGPLS